MTRRSPRLVEKRIEKTEAETDGTDVDDEALRLSAEIISAGFAGELTEDEFRDRWEHIHQPDRGTS